MPLSMEAAGECLDAEVPGRDPVRCRVVAPAALPPLLSGEPFQVWNPEAPSARFFHSTGGIRVVFPGVASFQIPSEPGTVLCAPDAGSGAAWRAVFHQQVAPLWLADRGEAVFHGGAVVVDGGAIAFLGPSGRGKSTLTAAFAVRGMPFLGDDCLHIDFDRDDRPLVRPQPAFVRVWADSLEQAAPDTVAREHPADAAKPRLLAGDGLPHCTTAMPLRAAFLLEPPADAIATSEVTGVDGMMGWVANAFLLDLKAPHKLAALMRVAGTLARTVPLYRVAYPRDYAALDAVVARIGESAGSSGLSR